MISRFVKFFLAPIRAFAEKEKVMEKQLREQVELIREVFAYIHRFKNCVFVFRINSKLMEHPALSQLINDLALLHENGIQILIIPGARQQIDQILETYQLDTQRCNGIRISTEESIPFIKMAAFDVCNKIMTKLSAKGKNALIGNWVKARSLGVVDGTDYQFTGRVSKVQINSISKALKEGYIPIFPCIGWNDTGHAYNISSDELAGSLSIALQSKKLFFIEDRTALTQGDLQLPDDLVREEENRISKLTVEKAEKLLELNSDRNDMGVLRTSWNAARNGVDRVHIVNGKVEGVILKEIFSNLGIGTMVFANIYEKIRPMQLDDISGVLSLMAPLAEQGILVGRTREHLAERLDEFYVYAVDEIIHGTGALHPFGDGQAEIAGLAVDSNYVQLQIGRKMVEYLLEQAKKNHFKSVFVLTTQTSDWFLKIGFKPGSVEDLPQAKRKNYNRERNSRILIYRLEEA